MDSRVFRGSSHYRLPRKSVPYRTVRDNFVTISNDLVEKFEDVYSKQPVADRLLTDGHASGDRATQPKPVASSVSKNTLAPAVAHLFSTFSSERCSVHNDISEIVDAYPQGIKLNSFCDVFEAFFHRPFDSCCTDVTSLRQMLENMADIVECIENGGEVIVRQKFGNDYFQGNAKCCMYSVVFETLPRIK